jgi:HEAT repeat protein
VFGSDHEALAMVLAPWGVSLLRLSRPMDAVQQLEKSYGLLAGHGKAASPDAVAVLAAWAEAAERLGWYPDALGRVDTAIRTVEKATSSSHPALVPLLERRASLLRKMGQSQEAEEAQTRGAMLAAAAPSTEREGHAAGPRYQGKTSAQWVEALEGPDRMQAYGSLLQADASAVPLLVELVSAPSVPVRMVASHALALLAPKDPERALPALVGALRDRSLAVRCWAADGLGAVGPRAAAAVPALVATLKTHPKKEPDLEGPRRYYADARMAAASALGSIGPAARAAAPDLRAALEDDEENVRDAAKDALARIEPPSRR